MKNQILTNNKRKVIVFLILTLFVLQFLKTANGFTITNPSDEKPVVPKVGASSVFYNSTFSLTNLTHWDENIAQPFHYEIYKDCLFAIDFYEGIKVYNISDISSPKYLTTIDDYIFPNSFSYSGAPTLDFVIIDDQLFITDYFMDLYVFNITDLYNPELLYTGESLDINAFYYFEVNDDYVFASVYDHGDDKILILDPSVTSGPTVIGTAELPGNAFYQWLIVADDLLLTLNSDARLIIFNISNIEEPIFLSNTNPLQHFGTYSYNMDIKDNLLVTTLQTYDGWNGFVGINFSDPLNPYLQLNCTSQSVPGLGQDFRDIILEENICFALDNELGLQTVNITNTDNVALLSTYDLTDGRSMILHSSFITALSYHGEIYFINVTNPTMPQIHSFINFGDSTIDVHLIDDYLYIANGYDGFYIFEIEDNNSLRKVSHFKDLAYRFYEISIQDSILYAITSENAMLVFDISNGSQPVQIASYNTMNTTVIWPDIIVEDNLAFIWSVWELVEIVNVTDPSNPEFLSTYYIQNDDTDFLRTPLVDVSRDLLICTTSDQIEIVNISNPQNPTILTNQTIFGEGCKYNNLLNDQFLYLNQNDQISIVDIGNPLNPEIVSTIVVPYIADLHFHKDSLFIEYYEEWVPRAEPKIMIYNCSNPARPFQITNQKNPFLGGYLSFSGNRIAEAKYESGFAFYQYKITCEPITTYQTGLSMPIIFRLFFFSFLGYFIAIEPLRLKKKVKKSVNYNSKQY